MLVALGFSEALEAAIAADANTGAVTLDDEEQFGAKYSRLVAAPSPSLLLCTVPDPFDTAFFMQPAEAAGYSCVWTSPGCVDYRLAAYDFLKLPAVYEISFQIFGKALGCFRPDRLCLKRRQPRFPRR